PFLIAIVIIGLSIDAYYFGLLQGLREFTLLAVYRTAANAAQLVLLYVVIKAGAASVPVVVVIYSLVYLIPIAVLELTKGPLRRVVAESPHPSRARLRALTKFAVPSLISGMAYAAILGF